MATLSAGYAFTAATKVAFNIATGSVLADTSITYTCLCAWNTTLAPLFVQLQIKGKGDASATGRVVVHYKWANLTASGSSTALLNVTNTSLGNWDGAMSMEMDTSTIVMRSTLIPVEGKHLALALENTCGGSVSAISLIAMGVHVKVV